MGGPACVSTPVHQSVTSRVIALVYLVVITLAYGDLDLALFLVPWGLGAVAIGAIAELIARGGP